MGSPFAYGQAGRGCQGVGFAKKARDQYSPSALQGRLKRNPSDVDALIHLGLSMEDRGKLEGADALYLRAIQTETDCSLGYYFAGFVEETISDRLASDSVKKITRAVSLDPSLRDDPNVVAFLSRHLRPTPNRLPQPTATHTTLGGLISGGNQLLIGVGIGLLLAAPLFYAAKRKKAGSK